MKSHGSGLVHDGWTSLADILTTLVCGILFVGTVTWAVARDSAHKTAESLTRLERLETQVTEIDADMQAVVARVEQARSLAAQLAPTVPARK